MHDRASFSIDRHTPEIPVELWMGLDPRDELAYTAIKNKLVLPASPVAKVCPGKSGRLLQTAKRIITTEMLAEAETALAACGLPTGYYLDYLTKRGLTRADIERWQPRSTVELVNLLSQATIDNLTLRLPDALLRYATSTLLDGVSFPYYAPAFCGFVTRILNHRLVKYAISVPQRLCFGIDRSKPDIYVVEGIFDAIALSRIGYNVLGLGDSQPNYFKMMQANRFRRVYLLFDDDYAGWLGAIKAHTILTAMLRRPSDTITILDVGGTTDPEGAVLSGRLAFVEVTVDEAVERALRWRKWLNEYHRGD